MARATESGRGRMSRRRRGSRRLLAAAAGLFVWLGQGQAQTEGPMLPEVPMPVATSAPASRPAPASVALSNAIEAQRHGQFEKAATLLAEAKAQAATLSQTERKELDSLQEANRSALQSRQYGEQLLGQAEKAMQTGQAARARDLVRKLVAYEQSLTPQDKQRLDGLQVSLRTAPVTTGSQGAGVNIARTKLQQARTLLAQGNFDAAESLAREAGSMASDFGPREDSPAKVREDVKKAKQDPKTLLAASRSALQRHDLDRAEELVTAAEKHAGRFTFTLASDSPSKVRKDIQAARKREGHDAAARTMQSTKEDKQAAQTTQNRKSDQGTTPAPEKKSSKFEGVRGIFAKKTPEKKETTDDKKVDSNSDSSNITQASGAGSSDAVKPAIQQTTSTAPTVPMPKRTGQTARDTDSARKLLEQGRRALAEGKYDVALKCAEEARTLNPELNYWEDNPARLVKDVQRAQGKPAAPAPTQTTTPSKPAATKTVTPPTLPAPVEPKADMSAAPKNNAEAQAMLKQGRKLMADGKYDEVGPLLDRVRQYQGKYGLFDDNPTKLQEDLRKAVTKRDCAEADKLMKEARKLYGQGDLDNAEQLAFRAQRLHGTYATLDLGDRPTRLLADIESARAKKKPTTAQNNGARVTPKETGAIATTGGVAAGKEIEGNAFGSKDEISENRARQLMAEATQFQTQGNLVAARQKAAEAQNLKVEFKAEEVSPERMVLQLNALAQQRIMMTMQRATDMATNGAGDPRANYARADQELAQVKALGEGFGFDVTAINEQRTWIAQLAARLPADAAPGVASATDGKVGMQPPSVPPPSSTPTDPAVLAGLDLLEKSRIELRKGNATGARKLAEDAFSGPYNVKAQAQQRLKEIDIEEHNQKLLASKRGFDSGVVAFNRGDYPIAKHIFGGINVVDLDPTRQAKLREIMSNPEMKGTEVASDAVDPHVKPVAAAPLVSPSPEVPGRAFAMDSGDSDLIKTTKAMRNIQFQAFRDESMKVRAEANKLFRDNDTEGAADVLQSFRLKLKESQLDAEQIALLERPIESQLSKFKLMKSQADLERGPALAAADAHGRVKQKLLAEQNKQKQVAELLRQFNTYYHDGKYKEAEAYARMAIEIDPDNPISVAAANNARVMYRRNESDKFKSEREQYFYDQNQEAGRVGPSPTPEKPLIVDKDRHDHNERHRPRSKASADLTPTKSSAVRAIESKLELPVNMNFTDTPLRQVIDDIRNWHGINVMPDYAALQQENISLERPVTIRVEQLSLKSVLNIVLRQADLTWVIRDDVLTITTPSNAKGKLIRKVYQVADLVIPIEDFGPSRPSLDDQLNEINNKQNRRHGNHSAAPGMTPNNMPGSPAGVDPRTLGSHANAAPEGATGNSNSPGWNVNKRGPSATMQDKLISLITGSIDPNSWATQSGPGTIDYFPLGMALVVNQTPDIQEQIADLLAALRRLQDQEVAIEIRLITIADAFFERMGMDLDIKLKTDRSTRRFEPQITTGQFKPAPFINDFSPSRLVVGTTPAGTFTSDLDIPINPTSFNMAVPPFGGFPNSPGNNGGLSLGLAFLSDIQVFLFMEAAQGDQRTNVMQAPKLTLFNGQTAQISVNHAQFFVTDVDVQTQGGQVIFTPSNQNLGLGVSMLVQAVISGDRRFVRVTIGQLQLTNLASAIVPLFPITTTIQPFFEGVGAVGQPAVYTQYLQQPVLSSVNLQTTVMVPDGGTVMMGGLKRLSEGRNEFGPPILSKIPYLNRLVKNVGYGREAESILLMVTPRIIITEEEETEQTGVVSNPQLQGSAP